MIELKKAKTKGWQRYCDKIKNLDHVARLQKVMKNGRATKIGTLKRSDGTYTENEEETLQELVKVLFPLRERYQGNIQTDFLTRENVDLETGVLDEMINVSSLKAAVSQFKPYK